MNRWLLALCILLFVISGCENFLSPSQSSTSMMNYAPTSVEYPETYADTTVADDYFGKTIQEGNAKNKGRNINKRINEISCVRPESFKFLLEVARFIKVKTRIPVNPQYKKTLASLKDEIRKPYTASTNIKLHDTAKTWKKKRQSCEFFTNFNKWSHKIAISFSIKNNRL